MLIINANSIHSLSSTNCVMAALQIELSMFDSVDVDSESLKFNCNSSTSFNKKQFNNIKAIIAKLLKTNSENNPEHEIMNTFYYV